jgi:hypothetical protein
MGLLPALAASVLCVAIYPAIVHLARNRGPTIERDSMTSTEDTYRIIESDGKVATETTVRGDGVLRVRVHLVLTATNFAWEARLEPAALGHYREEIDSLKRESMVTDTKPGFLAIVITPGGGESKIGAWDMANESPTQTRLRNQLDTAAHLRYAVGLAYLSAGNQAEKAHNGSVAGEAFKAGVQELGDSYRNPEALDDSGMKLVAARSKEKSAGIEAAASAYRAVLETRLRLYATPRNLPCF